MWNLRYVKRVQDVWTRLYTTRSACEQFGCRRKPADCREMGGHWTVERHRKDGQQRCSSGHYCGCVLVLTCASCTSPSTPPLWCIRCVSSSSGCCVVLLTSALPLHPAWCSFPWCSSSPLCCIRCVSSSCGGRIFLGGSDGHLYEVIYNSADGWRQKRCSKVGGWG